MRIVRILCLELETNHFDAETLTFLEFDFVVVLILVLGASVDGGSERNGLGGIDTLRGFFLGGHFLHEREGKHVEGAKVGNPAVGDDAVEMFTDAGVGGGFDFSREFVCCGFHPSYFKTWLVEENGSRVLKVATGEVDFDFRSTGDA